MCRPWKMTFTLVPLAPLTCFHPNGRSNRNKTNRIDKIFEDVRAWYTIYIHIHSHIEHYCRF
jgi:hypothetical protein